MKVLVETFGCQANVRDSQTILGLLGEIGYTPTDDPKEADLIIMNTCTVREKASEKVFSHLGALKSLKVQKPWLLIGICGCVAQEKGILGVIRKRAPYVDFVLGTHRLHTLPQMILRLKAGMGFQSDVEETLEIIEELPSIRDIKWRAMVNITYGCNNFCTYCIVPYVRGRERSRLLKDIMKESRLRIEEGAKEIMYIGQNVNSFGKTNEESFTDLIYEAQELEGLERITYMTPHPKDFSDSLITAIKNCDKVTRHIHLPVQSGSNKILKAMNRGYTRERYFELVDKIRSQIPEASFTTDIIVGFPGETDRDFEDTVDLVKRVKYDASYNFMYSPRKGTPAANWPEQLPLNVKKERLHILMEEGKKVSLELHQPLLGKTMEVLVEEWSEGKISGRSKENYLVTAEGIKDMVGTFRKIVVTDPQTFVLKGKVDE